MTGEGFRVKNKVFHMQGLCLRALDTNLICAKSVRRNEDYHGRESEWNVW